MKCPHITKHTEMLLKDRTEVNPKEVIVTWCADCGVKIKEVVL